MSSYKSSLAFLIVFISLFCVIMLGTPELEAKHLEPSNDSQSIHIDTQKERDSLTVEENGTQTTAGGNKPIQTPDSNSNNIITEKEEPYIISEHEENKYPQKIAHPNEDDRPIVPTEEALSDTTEQDNIMATPTPILSVIPTGYGHSLVEKEKEIHTPTPSPEGELSQAIPIEISAPHATEEHLEEESSIKEVPPQHAITTESRSDTDILAEEALSDTTAQDNTLVTPMPILPVTPTVHGQSLIEEEMEIHTPSPEVELSQAIPIENETPHGTEEHPGDESSIEEIEPQHAIITATPGDAEEKGAISAMPVPTPEYPAASAHTEESLVPIEKDKPSHDVERGAPTIPLELLPFTHIEGSSQVNEERDAGLPTKDTDESTTGIASEEHRLDTVKEEGVSRPAWDILHKDPSHSVILAIAIILIAAKIGELLAKNVQLPSVVGNLLAGLVLGNIYIFTGGDFFEFLKTMPFLKMISYFGTLILLFTAGLHTDIRMLLRAGASSLLVCMGGIIVPAGLGLVAGHFFLPDASNGTKMLLAIILASTGMGLLTAILGELKAMNTLEGRILIGAGVLTEIMVILSFGLVSGFVAREGNSFLHILVSVCIAISFLTIALVIILRYSEKFGSFLTKRAKEGLNIPIVIVLCLLLAFMTGTIGLHTVIGAFVAGLFLRNVKLSDSDEFDEEEYRTIESFIRPFYKIIVPILFVKVGAQVDLMSFLHVNTAILGLAITGAAIAGKMFCSVCPIERGVNRLTIGIGMAIKMEGTLILAGIGRDMEIFNSAVFSSAIMVIVLTSIICPYFLRAFLQKKGDAQDIVSVAKAEEGIKKGCVKLNTQG